MPAPAPFRRGRHFVMDGDHVSTARFVSFPRTICAAQGRPRLYRPCSVIRRAVIRSNRACRKQVAAELFFELLDRHPWLGPLEIAMPPILSEIYGTGNGKNPEFKGRFQGRGGGSATGRLGSRGRPMGPKMAATPAGLWRSFMVPSRVVFFCLMEEAWDRAGCPPGKWGPAIAFGHAGHSGAGLCRLRR